MRRLTILVAVALLTGGPAGAQEPPTVAVASAAYAPFEWLAGDWVSSAGPNTVRQNIRFGPGRSYLFFSTYLGRPEKLHFEGIAVWNGKSKALDYVFAVEPGSGVQEKGTIRAEVGGSIVREVEFTGPDGKVAHFRQTFGKTGPDSAITSLMRQTATGWEPTFPGSERLEMKRRPG